MIWPKGLKEGGEVKQIVYVYAHQKTDAIAKHIREKLGIEPPGEADPDYANKAFLFCGGQAVKGYNAMHLAYLAEADGVTTAGAGTTGEFAYLNKAGNQSRLLVLPIEGHNEQGRNADVMAESFKDHVTVARTTSDITSKLDELMSKPAPVLTQAPIVSESLDTVSTTPAPTVVPEVMHSAEAAPTARSMEKELTALSHPETYVQQATDILFKGIVHEVTSEMGKMKALEEKMRNDPLLKASRHYVKLVFQVFDQIQQNLERYKLTEGDALESVEAPEDKFIIKYKKEGPGKEWTLEGLKEVFSDNRKLYAELADLPAQFEAEAPELDLGSRAAVLTVLESYEETLRTGKQKDIVPDVEKIEGIEKSIGDHMTTGF